MKKEMLSFLKVLFFLSFFYSSTSQGSLPVWQEYQQDVAVIIDEYIEQNSDLREDEIEKLNELQDWWNAKNQSGELEIESLMALHAASFHSLRANDLHLLTQAFDILFNEFNHRGNQGNAGNLLVFSHGHPMAQRSTKALDGVLYDIVFYTAMNYMDGNGDRDFHALARSYPSYERRWQAIKRIFSKRMSLIGDKKKYCQNSHPDREERIECEEQISKFDQLATAIERSDYAFYLNNVCEVLDQELTMRSEDGFSAFDSDINENTRFAKNFFSVFLPGFRELVEKERVRDKLEAVADVVTFSYYFPMDHLFRKTFGLLQRQCGQ